MYQTHCTTRDYTKSAVSLCQGSPTCIVPSDARQPLSATLLTLTESLHPPQDAAVHKQTSSLPKEGCHGLGQSRVFLSCGSQVWLSNIRVCLWFNAPLTTFSASRPSSSRLPPHALWVELHPLCTVWDAHVLLDSRNHCTTISCPVL